MTDGPERACIETWHNREGIENREGHGYFGVFNYSEKNEVKTHSYCNQKSNWFQVERRPPWDKTLEKHTG